VFSRRGVGKTRKFGLVEPTKQRVTARWYYPLRCIENMRRVWQGCDHTRRQLISLPRTYFEIEDVRPSENEGQFLAPIFTSKGIVLKFWLGKICSGLQRFRRPLYGSSGSARHCFLTLFMSESITLSVNTGGMNGSVLVGGRSIHTGSLFRGAGSSAKQPQPEFSDILINQLFHEQ